MNAPATFPTTRWMDHRTSKAHADLDSLLAELHPETDAYSAVFHAMEAVEAADVALECGR